MSIFPYSSSTSAEFSDFSITDNLLKNGSTFFIDLNSGVFAYNKVYGDTSYGSYTGIFGNYWGGILAYNNLLNGNFNIDAGTFAYNTFLGHIK